MENEKRLHANDVVEIGNAGGNESRGFYINGSNVEYNEAGYVENCVYHFKNNSKTILREILYQKFKQLRDEVSEMQKNQEDLQNKMVLLQKRVSTLISLKHITLDKGNSLGIGNRFSKGGSSANTKISIGKGSLPLSSLSSEFVLMSSPTLSNSGSCCVPLQFDESRIYSSSSSVFSISSNELPISSAGFVGLTTSSLQSSPCTARTAAFYESIPISISSCVSRPLSTSMMTSMSAFLQAPYAYSFSKLMSSTSSICTSSSRDLNATCVPLRSCILPTSFSSSSCSISTPNIGSTGVCCTGELNCQTGSSKDKNHQSKNISSSSLGNEFLRLYEKADDGNIEYWGCLKEFLMAYIDSKFNESSNSITNWINENEQKVKTVISVHNQFAYITETSYHCLEEEVHQHILEVYSWISYIVSLLTGNVTNINSRNNNSDANSSCDINYKRRVYNSKDSWNTLSSNIQKYSRNNITNNNMYNSLHNNSVVDCCFPGSTNINNNIGNNGNFMDNNEHHMNGSCYAVIDKCMLNMTDMHSINNASNIQNSTQRKKKKNRCVLVGSNCNICQSAASNSVANVSVGFQEENYTSNEYCNLTDIADNLIDLMNEGDQMTYPRSAFNIASVNNINCYATYNSSIGNTESCGHVLSNNVVYDDYQMDARLNHGDFNNYINNSVDARMHDTFSLSVNSSTNTMNNISLLSHIIHEMVGCNSNMQKVCSNIASSSAGNNNFNANCDLLNNTYNGRHSSSSQVDMSWNNTLDFSFLEDMETKRLC